MRIACGERIHLIMKKALKITLIVVAALVVGAILLGVLNALFGDKWSLWTDYTYDDSGFTVGDGSIAVENLTEIDLDWVDGTVTVISCKDAYPSLTEKSENELTESSLLRWHLSEDGKLTIKYRESSFFLGRGKNKQKDLILRVPERFAANLSIKIHVSSTNVFLDGIAAKSVRVESDKGNVAMLSSAVFEELSIHTVSGKILVSGAVTDRFELVSKKNEIKVDAVLLPKEAVIETGDKDIRIAFSGVPSISLNFNEEKGKYASDFALSEQDGRLTAGDGYTKLEVTTKSGTLYLSEK